MDAYSRFNQIKMHLSDKTKTIFIIDKGNFCYRVMPFRLKNAGVTYQRLMDRIFKYYIGRQLEVYVDDMVVKFDAETLTSIFLVLRKHQLKLNLDKCSFSVKVGKFLGFMLPKRGIEANPEKCEAMIRMRSPKNLKEL
ncbi:Retrovirus-related Pol polyprotein from transposon 17.6, partial [Mucuna pruriens]